MGGGGANLLDSPKTGEKTQVWTTPTYKTYNDYFTDLNITKETITSEDLTGTGSKSDPYVVHSTKGFLWITNYDLSRQNLADKHLFLACDVFLNEEKFNEEGQPIGGDGVVYQWKAISNSCTNVTINGQQHTIYGLYINEPSVTYRGLFGQTTLRKCENLTLENFYVHGKSYIGALCGYQVTNLDNCTIGHGYIIAENEKAYGITCYTTSIISCVNKSTIKTINDDDIAGLAISVNASVVGCKNYGKLYNGKGVIAGIVKSGGVKTVVEDCVNYGELFSSGNYVGGITSTSYVGRYINCENYGTIKGNVCGGIVAQQYRRSQFVDCANYGKITSATLGRNGGLIGRVYCQSSEIVIAIKAFKQKAVTNNAIIGMLDRMNYSIEVNIENVFIDYTSGVRENIYCIANDTDKTRTKVCLKNVYVKCNKANNFGLIMKSEKLELTIANVLFEVNNVTRVTNFLKGWGTEKEIDCDGGFVIFHKNGASKYYGSDFSGFFANFKTGEIGLKSLSGKGFYQAKVTEEMLRNKGFEKLG